MPHWHRPNNQHSRPRHGQVLHGKLLRLWGYQRDDHGDAIVAMQQRWNIMDVSPPSPADGEGERVGEDVASSKQGSRFSKTERAKKRIAGNFMLEMASRTNIFRESRWPMVGGWEGGSNPWGIAGVRSSIW